MSTSKQPLLKYLFRSGIRKIFIKAYTLDEAKQRLCLYESDAWTDSTWNWQIEFRGIE